MNPMHLELPTLNFFNTESARGFEGAWGFGANVPEGLAKRNKTLHLSGASSAVFFGSQGM